MFSYLQRLLAPLEKILASISNLREGAKLLVFLKTVNKLEGIAIENLFFSSCYLTSIQDDLSLTNIRMKLHKTKILLFIKALLPSLFLQLVIFYEEKEIPLLNYFSSKHRIDASG